MRQVVQAATLAPSVHNTQPWRFAVSDVGIDLHAEPTRQLPGLDPTGRQLHLSCGAALANARVAARALGLDTDTELLPESTDRHLLARLRLAPGGPPTDAQTGLAAAVRIRRTAREPFDERAVPAELHDRLRQAAEAEGAMLRRVRPEEMVELEVLLSHADAAEERDPAYRAEMAAWVRDEASADGLRRSALPEPGERGSSLRLRDFLLQAPERTSGEAPPAEHPEVVVLTTTCDDPRAWLRAGQALELVLLHAAAEGVQAQPLGQVTDLPGPRHQLAGVLGLVGIPQLVLRLGYTPTDTAAHAQATARRALNDVLT